MAKARKRKQPVTNPPYPSGSSAESLSGSHFIRRFHVLLKRRERLLAGSSSTSQELTEIESKIETLGGLEAYQRMSARGQSEERGGGSEKVFVGWLKEVRGKNKGKRLRLLEVGAVKHDNYNLHVSWIDCTPIDLHSRHPLVQEQDFLKMDEQEHRSQWDAISLSLVLNFVPNPHGRGKMLALAHTILREGGYLFLALPLPCVVNSRYLDLDRLKRLMSLLGFTLMKERWKEGGKMAYWLFQKFGDRPAVAIGCHEEFRRKAVLKAGRDRNNFTILIP